ncbi:hypothetical protein BH11ARM2_BH11ARM2_25270 [soil metagenome]
MIVSLSGLGRADFVRQPTNSPHRHGYFEICLATAGSGRFSHGGVEFPVRTGEVFVADPEILHEISAHATRDLYVAFLSFTATESHGSEEESVLMGAFLRGHRTVGRPSYDLSRWLPLLGSEVPASPQARRLFLLEMLRPLVADETLPSAPPEPSAELRRASDYLDANLHRAVRAERVAEVAGMSERTLRRRFQEAYGQGVAAELLERRMNAAAHRLLMGFPVAEVAASVGMDPARFARAFRAARGLPPKRFQKEYRPPLGRTSG